MARPSVYARHWRKLSLWLPHMLQIPFPVHFIQIQNLWPVIIEKSLIIFCIFWCFNSFGLHKKALSFQGKKNWLFGSDLVWRCIQEKKFMKIIKMLYISLCYNCVINIQRIIWPIICYLFQDTGKQKWDVVTIFEVQEKTPCVNHLHLTKKNQGKFNGPLIS